MNSDEIWLLQLWSGTFGAAISAVAAAFVAILVVQLSNKHQSRLAKLQLKEQRAEAARQRTIAAVADLLAALSEFRTASGDDRNAIWAVHHRSHSAALRWYVEDRVAGKEAVAWAHHVHEIAIGTHDSGQDIIGKHTGKLATDTFQLLMSRTEAFTIRAAAWPHASPEERDSILKELEALREEGHPYAGLAPSYQELE